MANYHGAYGQCPVYRSRCRLIGSRYPALGQHAKQERQFWRQCVKLYGVTKLDWLVLYYAQGGVCAICEGVLGRDRFTHIDHDHSTGRVRGLLCARCNGLMKGVDDPDWLSRALAYKSRTA